MTKQRLFGALFLMVMLDAGPPGCRGCDVAPSRPAPSSNCSVGW